MFNEGARKVFSSSSYNPFHQKNLNKKKKALVFPFFLFFPEEIEISSLHLKEFVDN
jgi:hypothetical protein